MEYLPEPFQHLRHSGPADAEVACESSPVLELAAAQKGLIVAGEFQRFAAFFRRCGRLRFGINGTVPGEESDDGRSM
jgi:hypothetical protein